jgi:hypothetical protein
MQQVSSGSQQSPSHGLVSSLHVHTHVSGSNVEFGGHEMHRLVLLQ